MEQNKKKLFYIYLIFFIITILYIVFACLADYLLKNDKILNIIAISITILFILSCFILLYFENKIGYYFCKKCNNKFVPKYKNIVFSMHINTTRYLKCPNCNKRSWLKKSLK